MAKVTINPGFLDAADEVQQELALKAAETVLERAMDLAPVDTGTLKASLRLVKGERSWVIGSRLSYAGLVEFGTLSRMAQPYLRPALDSLKSNPVPV